MASFERRSRGRAQPRRISIAQVMILCLGIGSPFAVAVPKWQGSEVVRDEVTHVLNPAVPMEGRREIPLRELWRLGASGDDEGEIFGVVSSVFRDGQGHFFFLDSQLSEVREYTADGVFVRSMGRPGEGPGEFRNASDACLVPDGRIAVAQVFPGKAILFGKDGLPAGELPLKLGSDPAGQSSLVLMEMKPAGRNLAIACLNQTFAQAVLTHDYMLAVLDLSGALVHRVLDFGRTVDLTQGIPIIEAEAARFTRRWDARPDGILYTAVSFHDYAINVYSPDGKLLRVIEREVKPLARTPEEKARVEELFGSYARGAPNLRLEIESQHSSFESISARPDGTIWVLTAEGRWRAPDGCLGVYDVFDADGRFREQVSLMGAGDPREDGVFLLGDRVIVVGNLVSAVISAAGVASGSAAEDVPEEVVTITCLGM